MSRYNVADYNLIYIYAINDDTHRNLLKIGKASISSPYSMAQLPPNCPALNQGAHDRIMQQTRTALVSYELLHTELAVRMITMRDGSQQAQHFQDHDVHDVLLASGFRSIRFNESGRASEWFEVDLETAKAAITAVKAGKDTVANPKKIIAPVATKKAITLRREQEENVVKTIDIFKRYDTMLWNCKMRYGKTVTAYELIKRAKYQKTIVITHRPAVEDGWESDHALIFGGTNHHFIDKTKTNYSYDVRMDADNDRQIKKAVASGEPFVYFASIQDLRGSQRVGGKFDKNNAVFDTDWDLLVVDEAHEGTATSLGDAVIASLRKQGTKVLLLSGTPYNIMDEYEDNSYTWSYVDEQKAKEEWDELHPGERNPYEDLPKMNIFTFDLAEQIPTSYRYVTEDAAFNFREFFRVWTGDIERDYRPIPAGKRIGDFVYEDDVNNFLTLISTDSNDSNYPFSTQEYRDMFAHTFWIVPGVKEAAALSALIQNHPNFQEFKVANIAGDGDEEQPYDEALALVRSCIKSYPKTITISCGKLTTGVTVREWTGIMMLSGSSSTSAAGYMQAIFRVQSPGCINGRQKKNCYVFDFAPDRTLKVIAEVHRVTNKGKRGEDGAKNALGEFINFCPVIAIEGTEMRTYDVDEMMRQIKRISVDAAINSGFDDDTIYLSDAGMNFSEIDVAVLRKLSDVVLPQKKGKRQTEFTVNENGLTEEKRKIAERAKRKPKKELTPEEKEALELLKKQKEEQKKLFDLLRAVSIRLPLLFYGADADITEIIHLKDFIHLVDDESWEEFMPKGLKKDLFKDILKYYDEDVVVGAGLRIRKMAKAADELLPTMRAKRIVEIMSKFKNPDKETVLTPWRVVNMHMGDTLGGYNFFDEGYRTQLEEPRFVEQGDVTADIFLNTEAKVLEMNSKSGLYPLYLAYSFYMLNVNGRERDLSLEEAQKIWFETLEKHIFVLCKTEMARTITIRTLAGYSGKTVHAIYLTKLIEERMKDLDRLSKKLKNPATWSIGGERVKFDAVVGNPPYQVLDGGEGGSATPVYNFFVNTAKLVKPHYTSMIMPSRWFAGGRGLDDFRDEMLNDDRIRKMVDYPSSSDCFPGVEIKGGVCYFLWDRDSQGQCEINTITRKGKSVMTRPLLEDDMNTFIRWNEAISILKKVRALEAEPFSNIVSPLKPFGFRTFVTGEDKYWEGAITLYANKKVGYVNRSDITQNLHLVDKYKVYISRAYGAGEEFPHQILNRPFVGLPNSCCTETYLCIGSFEDALEAQNVAEYISTKFFRFMVLLKKNTQDAPARVYGLVPMQDFSKSWTDKELYAKYSLTQEEIDFIESMIKPMNDEKEIVYAEPADYFPKEIREKYKLGEFAE